ncbi:MAG: phosphatidylcholine/phosphatidylserine synthase [Alphaproteobacteria bacterium]|nr:phosphatidylcholine/phosphatidylserine synthase [Alphaproteobacteria bacterium]
MTITPLKPETKTETAPKAVGIHKMIPNLITLTALCAGLTAIQFSLDGHWDRAVIAIVVAALMDALDGTFARLLKATSDFGAQLDSLSDFLAFGIAPPLILYTWVLEDAGKIGWIAMLVFSAAMAIRLARFNVTSLEKKPEWKKNFFSGVPAPAGAGLALLPMFIWLQFPMAFDSISFANPLVGIWVIFVAGLMVSRIPTFSTKQIKIPAKMAIPALGGAILFIAALIQAPWETLTVSALAYFTSILFAIRHFRHLQRQHADHEDLSDMALGAMTLDDLTDDKDDAPKGKTS